ncbi:MAG: hypothetical protein LBS20_10830 [Prevotella sp.]|jgi:hypothetical protein|nr:hypothetical protein [Prevotella sp.]
MAIINTIEQLKETVKVNKDSPFPNWVIFLNDARDHFLVNYLGSALVEKLEEIDPASTTDENIKYIKILPLARRVLGPAAVHLSTDEMSINTGDSGHTVTKNDKLAPASDTKITKASESLLERAWRNLECLLEYIHENITDYPEWEQSKYYRNRLTKYFPSAEVFQDSGLIDIGYSRLTFEKLRQLIIGIEKTEVRPLLTDSVENMLFPPAGSEDDEQPDLSSLLEKVRAYIGARVAELHTSQTTRVQRSKNNNLEYKAVIRPLYSDESTDLRNYYVTQAAFWKSEIISMLPEFGIDLSGSKLDWSNEGKKIFSSIP